MNDSKVKNIEGCLSVFLWNTDRKSVLEFVSKDIDKLLEGRTTGSFNYTLENPNG